MDKEKDKNNVVNLAEKKKGYAGFRSDKKKTSRQVVENLAAEHPHMQKAAYEAQFAAQELEKLYNHMFQLVMGMNDMLGGVIKVLMDKGIMTEDELDQGIYDHAESRRKDIEEFRIASMGFGEKLESVTGDSLVLVHIASLINGLMIESFPKDMYFITSKTYLFPGFEQELLNMKVGEVKEFSLTMPGKFRVEELAAKKIDFKVAILDIRKKLERKDDKDN